MDQSTKGKDAAGGAHPGAAESGAPSGGPPDPRHVADAIRDVDGVARLHGGSFGEIATHVLGGRVAGLRFDDAGADVHVVVFEDASLLAVAEDVRVTASRMLGIASARVVVTIADLEATSSTAKPSQEHA